MIFTYGPSFTPISYYVFSIIISMNDPSLSANHLDLRIGPEEEVLVILLHGFLTLLTLLAIPNSAIYNDNNITILF